MQAVKNRNKSATPASTIPVIANPLVALFSFFRQKMPIEMPAKPGRILDGPIKYKSKLARGNTYINAPNMIPVTNANKDKTKPMIPSGFVLELAFSESVCTVSCKMGAVAPLLVGAPHSGHIIASSESCFPQCLQYIFFSP